MHLCSLIKVHIYNSNVPEHKVALEQIPLISTVLPAQKHPSVHGAILLQTKYDVMLLQDKFQLQFLCSIPSGHPAYVCKCRIKIIYSLKVFL